MGGRRVDADDRVQYTGPGVEFLELDGGMVGTAAAAAAGGEGEGGEETREVSFLIPWMMGWRLGFNGGAVR